MPSPIAVLAALGALFGVGIAASSSSSSSDKKTAQIPPLPPNGFPPGITPPDIIDGQFPGFPGIIPAGFPVPPLPGGDQQQGPPVNVGPAGRFAQVRPGEGPNAFTIRVSGPAFAWVQGSQGPNWKHLKLTNPSLMLNAAGDNYTNSTWLPGMTIRMPDSLPGGTAGAAPGGMFNGVYT